MRAEGRHEADRVGDALFLKFSDRRLIELVGNIADGKPRPDRLIVLGLSANEDGKLLCWRGLSEFGLGDAVADATFLFGNRGRGPPQADRAARRPFLKLLK